MMLNTWRWVVVALLCASATGWAAQAERRGSAAVTPPSHLRELVAQKRALLSQLLGDSLAAARIAASGHPQALQSMGGAREQYVRALAVLQAGDLGTANEMFNEAIWMIGIARQLAPDPLSRGNELRERNESLLASIESMGKAYLTHLSHLGRHESEDAAWRKITGLIAEARALAGSRLAESNRALLQAEYELLAAFSAVLSTKNVDYTPHFSDQKDEFQFEFERNRSYDDLIPLAIAELKPPADAIRLIARHVESNRVLRDSAQRLATARNYQGALNNIRNGTAELQRALLAAGLVVPQEESVK